MEKPEKSSHLEYLTAHGMRILKWILKELVGRI
jgi:hypothetical protein